MWFIFSLGIFSLILIIGYFFVLPCHKKRPVSIRKTGLVFSAVAVAMTLSFLIGSWIWILLLLISFAIVFKDIWFIYGVNKDLLIDTLEKATSATRIKFRTKDNSYILDEKTKVQIIFSIKKTAFLSFPVNKDFKKGLLTREVFRKFIQNHYMS